VCALLLHAIYRESWKWGNKSIPLGGAYLLYRWTRSTISFGGCDRYGCSVCACLYVQCSVHISEGGLSHPMSFRLTRLVCLLDCRSVSSRTLMSSSSSLLHAAALNISNRLGCVVIQPERDPFYSEGYTVIRITDRGVLLRIVHI
jgi:hypothetical protein